MRRRNPQPLPPPIRSTKRKLSSGAAIPLQSLQSSKNKNKSPQRQAIPPSDQSDKKKKKTLEYSQQKIHQKQPTRLFFPKSTPRLIYPPIPIQHGTGDPRFYQCSYCGFVSSRNRQQWHTKTACDSDITKKVYDHKQRVYNIDSKGKIIPGKPNSITFQSFVDRLYHEDNLIQNWQKQKLKSEYTNFIQTYNKNRTNTIKLQIITEAKEVHQQNQQMITIIQDQNQLLTKLIKDNQALKTTFNEEGFQIPQILKKREQYIQQIIDQVKTTFQTRVRSILYKQLKEKRSLDPQLKQYIVKELQNEIFKISVKDSFSSWKKDVEKILNLRLNRVRIRYPLPCETKTKQQARQNHVAYFLKSVPYSTLRNKRLFIELLRLQSQNLQIATTTFLHHMAQQGIQVPKVTTKIIRKGAKRAKHFVSIDTIKKKVIQLMYQNPQLACDLYFCFCLSLRLNDLIRVTVSRKDNTVYDYISIIQTKNNHEAVRVIPQTLKKLIFLSKNKYPITKQRLRAVKQYCFQNFNGFYLLRASAITAILSGLMGASGFNPHHVSSTTLKYYVNFEDYSLMNNIFHFQIDGVPMQYYAQTKQRLIIGKLGDIPIPKPCKYQGVPTEASFSFPSTTNFRQQQQLDNLSQQCLYNDNLFKYKCNATQFLESRGDLARLVLNEKDLQYMELLKFSSFSFFKLLASMINGLVVAFYNGMEVYFHPSAKYLERAGHKAASVLQMIEKDKCPVSFEKNTLEITQNEEVYQQWRVNQQKLEQQVLKQGQSELLKGRSMKTKQSQKSSAKLVVVIGGQEQCQQFAAIKYEIVQEQTKSKPGQQNKAYKRSQRLIKAQTSSKNILTKSQICKYICSFTLSIDVCLFCGGCRTVCGCCPNGQQKCSCLQEIKPIKYDYDCSSYSVNTSFGVIDQTLKKIEILRQQNNLKQKVQQLNRIHLTQMASSTSITTKHFLPWEVVTKQIVQQVQWVLKNQKYLPLMIKKVDKVKGDGVFSKKFIPANTVVGTYLGVIRSSIQASAHDDSIVVIGWYNRQQYYICCNQACNFGRFLNSSYTKEEANCVLRMAVIQGIGFCPFFVTKRNISANQELTWHYGKLYFEQTKEVKQTQNK